MLTCLKHLTESMQFVHSHKLHASDGSMETLLQQLVGFLLTFNEFVSPRTVESTCTDRDTNINRAVEAVGKKICVQPFLNIVILVI